MDTVGTFEIAIQLSKVFENYFFLLNLLVIIGTGIAGTSNTQLNYPVQLKFDIHNNLHVVDQNNNRIQRFDLLYNGC
jgi:hypothetical protein